MKNCRKLFKNCSIHDKNCEFSGPYNFWTPVKSNIPDFWSWNFWTLFGSEIEVGDRGRGMAPLAPPMATCLFDALFPFKKVLQNTLVIFFLLVNQIINFHVSFRWVILQCRQLTTNEKLCMVGLKLPTTKCVLVVLYSVLNHICPVGSSNCWINRIPWGDMSEKRETFFPVTT